MPVAFIIMVIAAHLTVGLYLLFPKHPALAISVAMGIGYLVGRFRKDD